METTVHIKDGRKISKAAPLPAEVRRAMTVDGISWIDVAFMTNKSFCANSFLSFSNSSIALTA